MARLREARLCPVMHANPWNAYGLFGACLTLCGAVGIGVRVCGADMLCGVMAKLLFGFEAA